MQSVRTCRSDVTAAESRQAAAVFALSPAAAIWQAWGRWRMRREVNGLKGMRQNDPVMRQDAVSVILLEEGRVLLVRRANPPSHNLYAFPGGRVDPGERLEEAALRELREETGLIARDPRPHRVYDLIERDEIGMITSHFLLTVFRATLDPASPADPVAADDALEAGWFELAAATDLPMPESVRECLAELAAEA